MTTNPPTETVSDREGHKILIDKYDDIVVEYDYDTKQKNQHHRGKRTEWREAPEYLWTKEEVVDYFDSNYPQYIGLPEFERAKLYITECVEKKYPRHIRDLGFNLLGIIPNLERERQERDYPNLVKEIELLKARVKKLEEQI